MIFSLKSDAHHKSQKAATFARKFISDNFKKDPNPVTLIAVDEISFKAVVAASDALMSKFALARNLRLPFRFYR